MGNDKIQLFEDKRIRTAWNEETGEWLFSIVDVVGILTDQPTPRNASTYWAVMKKRLAEEGANQLLTICKELNMSAADGKKRLTDVAGNARKAIEADTGKPVISSQNAVDLSRLILDVIESADDNDNDNKPE